MTALTLPEALKRTGNALMQGIAKSIVTTDALGARIPMIPTNSLFAESLREGDEPSADFIDDDGTTNDATIGTDDRIGVPLRRIVGNIDVDALADDLTAGAPGGQTAAQLGKKVKATWRKITDKLINGANVTSHTFGAPSSAAPAAAISAISYGPWLDSKRKGPGSIKYTHTGQYWQFRAPGDVDYGPQVAITSDGSATLRSWNASYFIVVTVTTASASANGESLIYFNSTSKEFDGLIKLCDKSMLIDPTGADGDAFSFALLDQMLRTEKTNMNRAFVMSAAMADQYRAAWRALGAAAPTDVVEGFGPVETYRKVPILEDDFIGVETVGATTTCQSIYLASLDETQGLALACANAGAQSLDTMASPLRGPVMGWRIKSVGELEGKDHRRTRVTWYGAPVLRSKLSLVRRRGVKQSLT